MSLGSLIILGPRAFDCTIDACFCRLLRSWRRSCSTCSLLLLFLVALAHDTHTCCSPCSEHLLLSHTLKRQQESKIVHGLHKYSLADLTNLVLIAGKCQCHHLHFIKKQPAARAVEVADGQELPGSVPALPLLPFGRAHCMLAWASQT